MRILPTIGAFGLLLLPLVPAVAAGPVAAGFATTTLPANDDGSTGLVPLGRVHGRPDQAQRLAAFELAAGGGVVL